jgi:predicted lipoprotein with Yx(FWY)xxD motif
LRVALLAGVASVTAVLVGCGSGEAATGDLELPQAAASSVEVQLTDVPGLGQILADSSGYALYMFPPDAGGRVTCTGPCAGTWPPLAVTDSYSNRAVVGTGVAQQLIGSLPDPNTGGRVVTYAGYPLYRYAGDVDPGTAHGQALFLNGGPWYVLGASGNPVTTDPDGQQ